MKKTEKELMYDERKRNVQRLQDKYWGGIRLTSFNFAVLVFLAIFVGFSVLFAILIVGSGDKIENHLYLIFPISMLGIVLAIFALFMKKAEISDKRKGFNPVSTQVCTKCNKVKADDGIYICDCGGEYILITKMKWVEPEESA